jgi:hypothetical protein
MKNCIELAYTLEWRRVRDWIDAQPLDGNIGFMNRHPMRWLTVRSAVICVVLACLAAGGACAEIGTGTPILESGSLRLGFDARGRLTQVADLANHYEFLTADSSMPLWRVVLVDGAELLPENAAAFDWEGGEDKPIELRWSGFGRAEAPTLQVIARVTAEKNEPVSRWRISVEGLGEVAVRTVAFPRVGYLAAQESETLAVPQWMGEATNQARSIVNPAPKTPSRREWDYPGVLSMQFVAFYGGDGRGLLLSVDDTGLMRKQFAVFGDGAGGLGMEVVHHAPVAVGTRQRYSPTYDVLVRTFDGDWFTAADWYRRWAREQWWVKASRVRTRRTPDWVRDTAVWVWNRGPSPGVLAPAAALQSQAAMPVSVFWHWWHGCEYDVGFPEYLPPREGTEAFRDAVADAEAQGIHAIVYMNQRLWGMTTKSWAAQHAAAYAVKQPDGTIQPEVYNTFVKAPCASMCMGTAFWRNTYADLAEAVIRELGVAGIYMDQACSSLACYDSAHGHSLGGGAYWMEGFKALEGDIRRRTKDVRAVALAGEGCGEGWLPYLDVMLSLQVSMERYAAPGVWEPLPLFNAVYYDCATQYGNYSSLTRPPYDSLWPEEHAPREPLALLDRKFATQFRLEQARSFVWGQQPTIANFQERHLRERADEIDYLLRIARLRASALKYLRDGVFLRPPDVSVPQAEIPISRLSIYAGQQDAVQEYTKTVPLVLASAWRAEDGEIGLALASIADHPVAVRIALSHLDYPMPDAGAVYRLTETGRTKFAAFGGGAVELEIEMDPRDVRIYEVSGR